MDRRAAGQGLTFPLSALVGLEDVVDALSCAVCGGIRTVLVSGPAGTGKTVAVRGAASLTGKTLVELPLNATAEQVFGTVDIDEAIRTGRRMVSDSVMRRADGNILVIDNVNLLPKGMLQGILDAVETGVTRAELEGTSVCESCDTILLATMDPSEAELSRHELDRFDVCVLTRGIDDPHDRRTVLRRALEFSSSPRRFRESFADPETELVDRVSLADPGSVSVPEHAMAIAQSICTLMSVDGHRGDLAVINTACALAALDRRHEIGSADLHRAVRMCLLHRGTIPDDPDDFDRITLVPGTNSVPSGTHMADEGQDENRGDDAYVIPESMMQPPPSGPSPETVFEIGETFDVTDLIPRERGLSRDRDSGRRGLMLSRDANGRCIGYEIPRGRPKDVALGATIRIAAPRQTGRDRGNRAIAVEKEDMRERIRVRRKGAKILFVVDGSGSMDAERRMVAVKGTILSMLQEAYRRRDMVGLVVFKGETAEEVMPMSRSVLTARRILEELPVGGRTPLTPGLQLGYRILRKYAEEGEEPVMIVMTDGWGNVNVDPRVRPREEVESTCRVIAGSGIRTVVIDTEPRGSRFRKAPALAKLLGAECLLLEEMDARHLSGTVTSVLMDMEAKEQNTR